MEELRELFSESKFFHVKVYPEFREDKIVLVVECSICGKVASYSEFEGVAKKIREHLDMHLRSFIARLFG